MSRNTFTVAQALARRYEGDIAGCMPDLLDAIGSTYGRRRREPSQQEQHDAVSDFAQDYIGDRERSTSTFEERRDAARIIADRMVGARE